MSFGGFEGAHRHAGAGASVIFNDKKENIEENTLELLYVVRWRATQVRHDDDETVLRHTAKRRNNLSEEQRMSEWFDDESFWIEMYPYMFSDKQLEIARAQVDKIISLVGCRGGSILDLCCGPGRHSLVFAEKNFSVTGVDKIGFLLDKAKKRAEEESLQIEWIQEDMRDFVRPDEFDLVISMFTSFGYFHNKDDDFQVLNNIFRSLKPGGSCLIDVLGKERLARIFLPTTSEKLPGGSILVERREIFDGWSRIRNEWIMIKDGTAKSFNFHHTIYSGQELKDRLKRVGFGKIRLFGNLDGKEYGSDAERLIVVAEKQASDGTPKD